MSFLYRNFLLVIEIHYDGRITSYNVCYTKLLRVPSGLSNVVAIAAGAYHSLALTAEGRVIGWGAGGPGMSGVHFREIGHIQVILKQGNCRVISFIGIYYSCLGTFRQSGIEVG